MKKFEKLYDRFPEETPSFDVSTIFAVDVEKYETMILYKDKNSPNGIKYVLAKRYETEKEAVNGHKEVINNLLKGKKYSGKDEIWDKLQKDGDLSQGLEMLEKAMMGAFVKFMMKEKN